jgi:hypothetical protein
VGEVGVAQQTVHGAGVDGGLEQFDKADLFVAEECADEEEGEGYEEEEPSGGALVLDGDFVGILDGKEVVSEEAFVQGGLLATHGGEEGVVDAEGLQAVSSGVGQRGVRGQCFYL